MRNVEHLKPLCFLWFLNPFNIVLWYQWEFDAIRSEKVEWQEGPRGRNVGGGETERRAEDLFKLIFLPGRFSSTVATC